MQESPGDLELRKRIRSHHPSELVRNTGEYLFGQCYKPSVFLFPDLTSEEYEDYENP